MNADRRAHLVAVISAQPLLAALLGAAVELAGYRAAFPGDDESEFDAIRRARPVAVLIDVEHPKAHDDALLGRATMSGATLIVFGPPSAMERAAPLAERHRVTLLPLPDGLGSLAEILARSHPMTRSADSVKR